tara:strand:- start:52 stop:876 length:825 start_codon:yes stop_codon:yes gene_type:complete
VIPFFKSDCIFEEETFSKSSNLGYKVRYKNKIILFIKKIKKLIEGNSKQTNLNFEYLTNFLPNFSQVLIIGGGSKGSGTEKFYKYCKTRDIKIESLDIYISKNITIVADAHYLPFPDNSFNIVIIQAVLEHVLNPQKVVSEINRVLKNKGIVYSETPFLQSVHEGAFDFTRFTHSGHRWLFKDFKEIKSGYLNGAFSSCLFILSYTFSAIFRNRLFGIILRVFFRRLATLLDKLIPEKYNIDLSCGCYFIGKKDSKHKSSFKAKEIKFYYSGSQ